MFVKRKVYIPFYFLNHPACIAHLLYFPCKAEAKVTACPSEISSHGLFKGHQLFYLEHFEVAG